LKTQIIEQVANAPLNRWSKDANVEKVANAELVIIPCHGVLHWEMCIADQT
jgi:Ulp1 family protease